MSSVPKATTVNLQVKLNLKTNRVLQVIIVLKVQVTALPIPVPSVTTGTVRLVLVIKIVACVLPESTAPSAEWHTHWIVHG